MRKYVFVAALAILSAGVVGPAAWAANAPTLGETVEIEFTPGMPTHNNGISYSYEFTLPIQQGDRFRFQITPVGGAELNTRIEINMQGRNGRGGLLECTGYEHSHDWTMTKVPPGNLVYVDVMGQALGKVRLRVTRVGDDTPGPGVAPAPASGPPTPAPTATSGDAAAEIARLRALVEDLRRRNADLEDQIAVLKSQKGSR